MPCTMPVARCHLPSQAREGSPPPPPPPPPPEQQQRQQRQQPARGLVPARCAELQGRVSPSTRAYQGPLPVLSRLQAGAGAERAQQPRASAGRRGRVQHGRSRKGQRVGR